MLAHDDVPMGVRAFAAMDGERIWKRFSPGRGQSKSEFLRKLDLLFAAQLERQSDFDLLKESSVGSSVQVGRLPVEGRILLSPSRHVAAVGVDKLPFVHSSLRAIGITAFSADIGGT
jgi:hypothetical protein